MRVPFRGIIYTLIVIIPGTLYVLKNNNTYVLCECIAPIGGKGFHWKSSSPGLCKAAKAIQNLNTPCP